MLIVSGSVVGCDTSARSATGDTTEAVEELTGEETGTDLSVTDVPDTADGSGVSDGISDAAGETLDEKDLAPETTDVPEDSDVEDDRKVDAVWSALLEEWHEFGATHVLVGLDGTGDYGHPFTPPWENPQLLVQRFSLTMQHAGGGAEEILAGDLIPPGRSGDLPLAFWHVVAVPAPQGPVTLCLHLYAPDGALRVSGCQDVELVPLLLNQFYWTLAFEECIGLWEESRAVVFDPDEDDSTPPVLLNYFVTSSLSPCPEDDLRRVHLARYPPVACSEALDWFADVVAPNSGLVPTKCTATDLHWGSSWTTLVLKFPTAESAVGFYQYILTFLGGQPTPNLRDRIGQNPESQGPLMGVMSACMNWGSQFDGSRFYCPLADGRGGRP
jgi:hypothetical protein